MEIDALTMRDGAQSLRDSEEFSRRGGQAVGKGLELVDFLRCVNIPGRGMD